MAAASSQNPTHEPGIIILGNAGAGKSYLCNILIGYEKFEAAFRPEAVTTTTEYHRVMVGSSHLRIYNIPGLVEVNQDQIDRNKKEIVRAFEESPLSVVIFVWTQIGGRAQQDDVIAFNALNEAYKFPPESLVFVVNNVPESRPPAYEGQFIATLSTMLKPMSVSMEDVIFIDSMKPEEKERIHEARSRLLLLIDVHHACMQKQRHAIILQSDQLAEMRALLKRQRLEAEKDKEANQKLIQKMVEDFKIAKQSADEQYQQMEAKLENAKMEAERDRERNERERAKIEADFTASKENAELQHRQLMSKMEDERQKAENDRKQDESERAKMQAEYKASKEKAELQHQELMRKMEDERQKAENDRKQDESERAKIEADFKASKENAERQHQQLLRKMKDERQKADIVRKHDESERAKMQAEYKASKEKAELQHQELMKKIDDERQNTEKERQRYELERANREAEVKAAKETAELKHQQLMTQGEANKNKSNDDRQCDSTRKKNGFFASIGGLIDGVASILTIHPTLVGR